MTGPVFQRPFPADSPLRPLLEPSRSTNLGAGVVIVDCSAEEVERLLEIARKACPRAVIAIQKALTLASRSDS